MRKFLAGLLYYLIWIITLPPLQVLYLGSWIGFLIMHIFPGYRKQIVFNNLSTSFPELPEKDVRLLRKKYYKHLSQVMVEAVKAMHWSTEQQKNRIILKNPELLHNLAEKETNIVVLAGHTGNWEWLPALVAPYGYDLLGVYKPQSSLFFNDITVRIRKKKGVYPISMRETARAIRSEGSSGKPKALLLIADQIPAKPDIHFWSDFLKQNTAWFTGGEKIARKYKLPVVYMRVIRTGRGKYEGTLIPVSLSPDQENEGEITRNYIRELEKNIRIQPECWLWSHRRWKHQPENLSLQECPK